MGDASTYFRSADEVDEAIERAERELDQVYQQARGLESWIGRLRGVRDRLQVDDGRGDYG